MPLLVITINIHTIRMACQLAANIERSNKGGSIKWNSMREMWRGVGPWDFFPWSLHNHLTDQQINSHNWHMTMVYNWAHKRQGYTVVSLSCTFVIHWLKTMKTVHTVTILHVPIVRVSISSEPMCYSHGCCHVRYTNQLKCVSLCAHIFQALIFYCCNTMIF